MEQINLHSLVLMIGPAGSGKSTVAARHFAQSEIVSSDGIRAELLGDFRIQTNQLDVWNEVFRRTRMKLEFGQRAVVDATNLKQSDRKQFVAMAKELDVELVYIVVNRPLEEKLATAGWREEGGISIVTRHEETFQNNLQTIKTGDNGVARVVWYVDGNSLDVVEQQNVTSQLHYHKDIIVIGDVHGNASELEPIVNDAFERDAHILFLGDIVDYGDHNLAVFNIVYDLIRKGRAHMVWGNHERKLDRWLAGDFGVTFKGTVTAGLAKTVSEIEQAMASNPNFKEQFLAKWRMLHTNSRQHFVWEEFLFTHGAATVAMWEMAKHSLDGYHSSMAYFGEIDRSLPEREDGFPNRVYNWTDEVPAGKTVVVGHDPRSKSEPFVVTNTQGGRSVFLDTGSSKGGKLSYMLIER